MPALTCWNSLWAFLLTVFIGGFTAAGERPARLAKELQNVQRREGLSLLQVGKGAIWQLEFRNGTIREVVKLPPELSSFPEDWDHLENYSLNWKQQKLAGMDRNGLFVADLTTGKVQWYKNPLGSSRMSLNHKANQIAFQSFGYICVLDLATGQIREIAAGMNKMTCPQWSENDDQLLFHKWEPSFDGTRDPGEVIVAKLKNGQMQTIGEGWNATWVPGKGEITLARHGPWHTPFSYWTVSLDGGKGRKLLPRDEVSQQLYFSPDGKYAAYERGYRWDINIKGYEYGEVAVVRLADKKSLSVYGPFKRNSWTRGNALPLTWAYLKDHLRKGKE